MWLVSLYPGSDREEFIEFMVANDYVFNEFEFIPLLFEVEEPFDHPFIETIEDGEWRQTKLDVRQTITVNADLAGPDHWALPRITRRKKPWYFDTLYTGIASFYEVGLDGDGVDIYVVDSGFNVSHDEIVGRAVNVADYTTDGSNVDENGHGTACASAAAGLLLGSARSSLLWSMRCFDSTNTGQNSWIVNAINAAISHYNDRAALNRAAVMNLSLSGTSGSLGTAAAAAVSAGIVVVAAAGNDSASVIDTGVQPASTAGLICVGGVNANDGPYYTGVNGTNWGSRVDILAPSQTNRVADHTGNSAYKSGSGTSYGCAVTTGVVACLLTGKPRLTSTQVATVRQYLMDNATTTKFKPGPNPGSLPDRILYFDPALIASPFDF